MVTIAIFMRCQMNNSHLDNVDLKILIKRKRNFARQTVPTVGDYVLFKDGRRRRISHVWDDSVQTSDGGSWYISDNAVSFSGGLFPCVKKETLSLVNTKETGIFWFFSHDEWRANNGVHCYIDCRVWVCTENAPK